MADRLLICSLLRARKKARAAAAAELLSLLGDLGPTAPPGGPLSERSGVFWIGVPAAGLERATERLPRLGYTRAVDLLEPSAKGPLRWRGERFGLRRLYELDEAAARERAPDRRTFLLPSPRGVRSVRGYRGTGAASERRALPVADARLLVNLALPPGGGTLLDPFAGAGGIVVEALAAGARVLSADTDPILRHGLSSLGAAHCVVDARALPFEASSIDAIATEPPYQSEAHEIVERALAEAHRVITSGGRIAMLCAAAQAQPLRARAGSLGLRTVLDCPIDRKGTSVVALAWERPQG